MKRIYVEKWVEVEVDPGDFSDDEIIEICKARGIPVAGEPSEIDALVEKAYLDCRAAPVGSIPQSVRDLLWKVHGRAIA